jgi:predicted naringenin-chalcone synthase
VPQAYINRIGTAWPAHEVHGFFLRFALSKLTDPRRGAAFSRMADRSGIKRRYSVIAPGGNPEGACIDASGLFRRGAFPGVAERMAIYQAKAPELAETAIDRLGLGEGRRDITHLIVATCTGLSAPGVDIDIIQRCGLPESVERTIVGFMGCYAAINALKLARHIVRSEPDARVLVVNVELCTLHLKETEDLEELLTFCLWGDGCAAALVTAESTGLRIDSFHALLAMEARDLMSWDVREDGFDMVLSGQVPSAIHEQLGRRRAEILGEHVSSDIDLWAVHPGGKSVLDAVERALDLRPQDLTLSREVLREQGNMSSATVMFVLEKMLATAAPGLNGCAMAFGPGLTAETMMFRTAG